MKNNLLVFGTKNFNNSLFEIQKYLDFSLSFHNDATLFDDAISATDALLVDSDVCADSKNLSLINSVNNKPILLIEKKELFKNCNYTKKIIFPIILSDFNTKIVNLIITAKFIQNSSLEVKEYTIDKNEKTLKKNHLSIIITEKEIQLIERGHIVIILQPKNL